MSSLIACVACAPHFKRVDAACPHCGAAAPVVGGGVLKTATALLMGLGLTGCVEALYGVPTTESDSASGGTDATTTAGTTEDTAMTESGSGTSAGTSGSAGTTAATTTASTTSMTTAEPDDGVPATSGILPRP